MDNIIFVFGANLRGIHGAGAAKYAREHFGAELGVGEGPTGRSYALPTKFVSPEGTFETRKRLDVRDSIHRFLDYARQHPELKFKVTRVGCGLAGFIDRQIAPFFAGSPENCGFDPEWSSFGLRTWEEVGIPA